MARDLGVADWEELERSSGIEQFLHEAIWSQRDYGRGMMRRWECPSVASRPPRLSRYDSNRKIVRPENSLGL